MKKEQAIGLIEKQIDGTTHPRIGYNHSETMEPQGVIN